MNPKRQGPDSTESIASSLFAFSILRFRTGVEMIVKTSTMRLPVFWVSRFALSMYPGGMGGLLIKTCFAVAVCLWAFQASAQQTYKAASCSQTDVQTAINSEIAHAADGDTIAIPAGSCTWTGGTPVSVNFTKSVTIQGAGAISATAGGASTTGTDQTIIINHMSNNKPVMSFSTTSGKSFRFTGIAVIEDGGSLGSAFNGNISIYGKSTAVRVDHCHFFIAVNGSKGPLFAGSVTGVVDHVYINTNQAITNNLVFQNGAFWGNDNQTTGGFGNGSWADGDHWGTNQFMYVEDTRMDGGYGGDCVQGGRWVLRHSTVLNNHGMEQHGTHDQYRGCRASESYLNTFNTPAGTSGGTVHSNSGASLVWGNAISGYRSAIDLQYYRINGIPYGTSPAPPNGFGMCPGIWDNGSTCLDLPSRGGGDLLTNLVSSFADIVNSATGTRAWPRQALSPIYAWSNTLGGPGASSVIGDNTGVLAANRDYYQQFGAFGESGTFDGTRGVGQGALSARPSTCSAGPGGNAPGVGYWATDTNTLYVCNPTNNWKAYYTPLTYPHPLALGTSSASQTSVAPPTGLTATVQ